MAQGSSNPTSNLTKVKNTAVDVNTGNASAGTQRVVIATNQPTLPVTLIGGSGNLGNVNVNQVYAEDSAAVSADSLFVAGAVREDTLAVSTSATGDYTWLKTNNLGRLYTSAAIDTSLPAGSNIVGKSYITDGTRDATIKAGLTAALAADTSLVVALHPTSSLPTGSNTVGKVDLNAGSNTIGKVDINQVYAEDAASAGGEALHVAGAVREDTLSTSTSASGDFTWLKTTSVGRLWTSAVIDTSLPAGSAIVGKTYLTDGTRDATVKAASTAALATDTSLVTAFSPNSSLPTGSNTVGKMYITNGTIDATLKSTAAVNADVALVTAFHPLSSLPLGSNTIGKVDINQVYAEDVASTGGESLHLAGAIRQDSIATSTSADGDYSNLKVNSIGRLYTSTTLDASIPTGTNTIGKVNLIVGPSGNEINIRNSAAAIGSITGIQITGTGGQFSCTSTLTTMIVGQFITLSGTAPSGSVQGTITGYVNPTTYRISATNGNTSFTLVNLDNTALTTTSGSGGSGLVGAAAALETALVTTLRDSLPTGYNVIGKLAPNTGTNIGTVDANIVGGVTISGNISTITSITTANLAADHSHAGNMATADKMVMTGGFANSTAPTAVTDGKAARFWTTVNGALNIADAGGSLTVDAPVTTPVFVRLSDGTSAISTLPVSLASVPSHPVTNGGTFVVQENGAALTSLQLLDDVVATNGSTALTKGYHIAGTDGTNARILSTNTSGHVNIADGGNSLTVDAPVGTPIFVRLSDGTNAIATLPVSLASVPSHPVTNAGTFVVQVDGAALTALQANSGTITTVGSSVSTTGQQVHGTDGTASRAMAVTTSGFVKVDDGGGSITVDGNIVTSSVATQMNNNSSSTALAASLIIKAGAGNLYVLTGYNDHTAGQFIQLFNSTTLPADGVAPVITFYVSAKSNFSLDFGVYGRYFGTGIVACNSTTAATKTIGAANCWFDAQHK